jgi:hypothetical protein
MAGYPAHTRETWVEFRPILMASFIFSMADAAPAKQ